MTSPGSFSVSRAALPFVHALHLQTPSSIVIHKHYKSCRRPLSLRFLLLSPLGDLVLSSGTYSLGCRPIFFHPCRVGARNENRRTGICILILVGTVGGVCFFHFSRFLEVSNNVSTQRTLRSCLYNCTRPWNIYQLQSQKKKFNM